MTDITDSTDAAKTINSAPIGAMDDDRSAPRRRVGWLRATLITTGVAALLVGGASPVMAVSLSQLEPELAMSASATGTTAVSTTDVTHPEGCGIRDRIRVWRNAPDELKYDVREVRAMEPGEERRTAAIGIRDRAVAGEYGEKVQERAQWVKDNRPFRAAWSSEQLRADFRDLRAADPEHRREFAQQLKEKALEGGYGDVVQQAAERAAERCASLPAS